MTPTEPDSLNALLTIFNIEKKAELSEHCRTAVVTGTDLANLILACQMEAIPIGHLPVFKHHHPEHLNPTDEDRAALVANGVGKLSKEARKFTSKIGSMFEQRRLFCGHFFLPFGWPNDWHFFYFDQRDTDHHHNHWEHGSHLHLMNMVTHPRLSPIELAQKLDSEDRPKLGGTIHIRFHRHDKGQAAGVR